MRSPEEAELAANIVLEALACGVNPKEIAVVAPYRAQCRMIKHKIREYAIASNRKNFEDIVVDTVERIQGQERDIVIISLTTSDPTHAAQRAEFYFQPNRLNVAITRPRVKRIVIGSINLFDARPLDPKLQEWVDNFRALYHQSYVVRVNN
jgi:DNA replication ATP-dependent helicase Dna2